jgi:hypothetical protein
VQHLTIKTMTINQEIRKVVKEFNSLCELNKFEEAGNLSRKNKSKFISFIKCNGSNSLRYAYKVCNIFNMRQTDCFNLIF